MGREIKGREGRQGRKNEVQLKDVGGADAGICTLLRFKPSRVSMTAGAGG